MFEYMNLILDDNNVVKAYDVHGKVFDEWHVKGKALEWLNKGFNKKVFMAFV